MPRYEITSPDGGRYEVTAPEGATDEDVLSFAQSQWKAPQAAGKEKSWGEAIAGSDTEAGIARTALDQSLQGATFGFADEITDRIGAGIASLVTDTPYSENLDAGREMSQERMQRQMEQRPALSIGSQLAGGILTSGAASTTAPGKALTSSLGRGGLGLRAAKGAAAGAASGALYGAGTGTGSAENRLESAGEGAILGAAFGAAAPVIGAAVKGGIEGTGNLIRGAGARGVDELDDVANAMRQQSALAYKNMTAAGATFTPQTTRSIITGVQQKLQSDGILNKGLHGKTMSVIEQMKKTANPKDFTLESLDQWRQLLGDVAGELDPVTRRATADARKARLAIEAIDDAVSGLNSRSLAKGTPDAFAALKTARAEWRKASKFQQIANIVKKSDGDANYLKRELKKLADNPKLLRGFTQAERDAVKEASSLSAGEGIMKMLGKFGIDLGNSRIGNTGLPVLGTAAAYGAGSGGLAAAVPVVGTAARQGQKYLARGKAENVLRAIEGTAKVSSNAPLKTGLASVLGGEIGGALSQYEEPQPAPEQPAPQSSIADPLQDRIAMAESGGKNIGQHSPLSSASGLFGFTKQTWKDSVRKYGNDVGVKMGDRNNPDAQRRLESALRSDHAAILRKSLNREPTDGELYLAHFVGVGGAKRLLKAPSGAPAARILPSAVRKNKNGQIPNKDIFYDNNNHMRTVSEVISIISGKV